MTEATLTVPTAFEDISQLAEGLADRVDEGRLMLYGPSSYDEGAWVRFAVLLADESAALEGMGRVVTSIDGGDERPDVARWDVVLDNLQLEGMGEVVYERILMVRGAFGDEQATGEVSLDDVENLEDVSAQPGDELMDEATSVAQAEDYQQHVDASADESEYGQPMGFDEGDATAVSADEGDYGYGEASAAAPDSPVAIDADFQDAGWAEGADEAAGDAAYGAAPAEPSWEEPAQPSWEPQADEFDVQMASEAPAARSVPPSAPPPAPPERPGGFHIEPLGADGRVLTRPSRGATWYPEVVPPPDPTPSSGLFGFAGGLPVPPRPPRPDIDPSMRVHPAPRPQNGPAEEMTYVPPVQATDATDPSFTAPSIEGELDSLDAQPVDDWADED